MTLAPVPALLHFVWYGRSLPWFAALAIESALRACPEAQAILWAGDALEEDAPLASLRSRPRFTLRPLPEPSTLLDGPDGAATSALLSDLVRALPSPAARANLMRLLILARHGGVYLDTDTLTLRDLSPLLPEGAFCGVEHVVWPLEKRGAAPLYPLVGGLWRELVRAVCARAPGGEALFAHVAPAFFEAANNAVVGAPPRHPLIMRMLGLVAALPADERTRRYRLGTHLLQQALAEAGPASTMRTLAPAAFYPLGPELSRQYFRPRRDVEAVMRRIVQPETYLVHWYASVSELRRYDEARVRAERDRSVFAALCCRVLDAAPC